MGKKNLFKFLKIAAYVCGFPLMSLLIFLSFKPMVNAEYMDAYITGWVWATLGIWAAFELIRFGINKFTANKKASTQRVANIAIVAVSVLAILLPVSIYGVVQKGDYESVQAQAKKEGVELQDYNKLLGWANAYTKDQDVDSMVDQLNAKIADFINTYNLDDYNTEKLDSAKGDYGKFLGVKETLKKEIENKEKLQANLNTLLYNLDVINANNDRNEFLKPYQEAYNAIVSDAGLSEYKTAVADLDNANKALKENEDDSKVAELEKAVADAKVKVDEAKANVTKALETAKTELAKAEKALAENKDEEKKAELETAVETAKNVVLAAEKTIAELPKAIEAKIALEEKIAFADKAPEIYKELEEKGVSIDPSFYKNDITYTLNDLLDIISGAKLVEGKVIDKGILEKLVLNQNREVNLSNLRSIIKMIPSISFIADYINFENSEFFVETVVALVHNPNLVEAIKPLSPVADYLPAFFDSIYGQMQAQYNDNFSALVMTIISLGDMVASKTPITLLNSGAIVETTNALETGKSVTELKTLQAEIDNYGSVMAYSNVRHIAYIFSGIVGIMTLLSMLFASKEKALKKEEQKA